MFQYPVQSVRTRSSIRPSGHRRLHPPWSESPLHNRWQAPNGRSFHSPFRLLKLSGQPIIVRIASVGEVLPLVGPLSFCLFADFHPFQLFGVGEVDIEAGQRRQAFSRTLRAISRIYSPAGSKSASGAWLHSEKPIEGTPFRQPSITTPIVPE